MGIKTLEGKLEDSCLENIKPGEPFFVVRGRDPLAPAAIRAWASAAKLNGVPMSKVTEAYQCANRVEKWQKEHGSKIPD